MNEQKYLIFDYETFSEANLKLVGAFEYAVHPSTEIICAAWKLGTRQEIRSGKAKTRQWCEIIGLGDSEELRAALTDNSILVVAHNAGFEKVITKYVLGIDIPLSRWICTAAMAATHALPRNLEGACEVLNLPAKKNPEGKKLIQRHSKPRKPTKKDPSRRNVEPESLRRFSRYCADDVDATAGVFLALPLLSPGERAVWQLNQKINTRGIRVDRELIKVALKLIAEESRLLDQEMLRLTAGEIESARKTKALMGWLYDNGARLPNLQKKTIEDALAAGLATGKAKRALEIRLAISKTSTAKYQAFEMRSRFDSRVRDLQLYHGASTGREAGTGIQPHNMPKPVIDDPTAAIEDLKSGCLKWVRALHGDPLAALSSCLRGAIVATPRHEIFSADFNAIEARVLFWMAGHATGLALFTTGADPYREQAAVIYTKELDEITSDEREVGKRALLGCGFGMGAIKFHSTCRQFGMEVTPELALRAVKAYRDTHHPVPRMWSNLERAAILAVMKKKRYTVNRTSWFVEGKFLYCELPSGRRLAYFKPEVRFEPTPWGDKRPRLYFECMNSLTRKWGSESVYGGLLTENVVQATARDLMVFTQLTTAKAGYHPMFSVHDELNAERKKGQGSLEEFEKLMATLPPWAKGLPVKVKGWTGERYRK